MPKLSFQRLKPDKEVIDPSEIIEVSYNPSELALSKSAQYADIAIPGLDGPVMQYVRGDAETLALELFFDSTEAGTGSDAGSVLEQVDRFHRFVKLDGELHSPPIVRVSWGDHFPGTALGDTEAPRTTFDAVVVSVARRFTLFGPEGAPLRATVSLQLREYMTIAEQVQLANLRSADHTRVHVVREGETLPLIAHHAYEDPGKWRLIASHNDLGDVRDLTPGTRLELPPTR